MCFCKGRKPTLPDGPKGASRCFKKHAGIPCTVVGDPTAQGRKPRLQDSSWRTCMVNDPSLDVMQPLLRKRTPRRPRAKTTRGKGRFYSLGVTGAVARSFTVNAFYAEGFASIAECFASILQGIPFSFFMVVVFLFHASGKGTLHSRLDRPYAPTTRKQTPRRICRWHRDAFHLLCAEALAYFRRKVKWCYARMVKVCNKAYEKPHIRE